MYGNETKEETRRADLHLRGYPHATVIAPADVERDDADVVSGDEEGVVALVVDEEGKHAPQVVQEVGALLHVEGDDRLAVRPCERLFVPPNGNNKDAHGV